MDAKAWSFYGAERSQCSGEPCCPAAARGCTLRSVIGDAPTATATLEIDTQAAAPRGVLSAEIGPRLEFYGWAELAAAIEAWRAHVRGAAQSGISPKATQEASEDVDALSSRSRLSRSRGASPSLPEACGVRPADCWYARQQAAVRAAEQERDPCRGR